jgi:hypothetical protein
MVCSTQLFGLSYDAQAGLEPVVSMAVAAAVVAAAVRNFLQFFLM